MDCGTEKSNTTFGLIIEGNHEKNPNQFGKNRDFNSGLAEHESNVMNFIGAMLCASKTLSQTALHSRWCWNKSIHLQPLQRCYCWNSGSPASTCVMRHHCFITHVQSLDAVNGLLAVGRLGDLQISFCFISSAPVMVRQASSSHHIPRPSPVSDTSLEYLFHLRTTELRASM